MNHFITNLNEIYSTALNFNEVNANIMSDTGKIKHPDKINILLVLENGKAISLGTCKQILEAINSAQSAADYYNKE